MIDFTKKIMEAMKSHDKSAAETYKMIKAKITEFKTQKNAPEYNDETEIRILQKMSKERKDTAKVYLDNNRQDLADKEIAEAGIIDSLLPKIPTKDDIEAYINTHYPDGIDKKNFGNVIKEVKSELIGSDGSIVAGVVKSHIV